MAEAEDGEQEVGALGAEAQGEAAPEPEPEARESASADERGSIAPHELVHWSVGMVARWLDSTFGDPDLARGTFDKQVSGAQLARLDAELWSSLGQPRRVLQQNIAERVRQVQAEQHGRLRTKIGATGRKSRLTTPSDAVSSHKSLSPSAGARDGETAVENGLLDEFDGVCLGDETGRLHVFRTMMQWIPCDMRKVLTIPLHSVEQTADSPKASGGGMFASYKIEASVSKENGSSFELVLEFSGSNAKAKRNTVLRMMQLSVAERAEQERLWIERRVSLPQMDDWGGQTPGLSLRAAEQASTAEHGLPSSVEILAEMSVSESSLSSSRNAAYVMQCIGFNRHGEDRWALTRKLSDFTELQSKLVALGKRQSPTSDSIALFETFSQSVLPNVSVPATQTDLDRLAGWVNSLMQALIWNGVPTSLAAEDQGDDRRANSAESDISHILVHATERTAETQEPLEQVLLRVTDASEEKADPDDIQKVQRTVAATSDVMQCNTIIHWLAARMCEENSSIKIKTLALIKNLANLAGGVLFRYSVRGMIAHSNSGAAQMVANLEGCSTCKLSPHPVHGDKPERLIQKHAMSTLVYLRQPLLKEEKQQAYAMIKKIQDAGDLTGGGEAALALIRSFISPPEEPFQRQRDEDDRPSLLDSAALAVHTVLPALPLGVNCELLDVLGGGVLKNGWLWVESPTHKWARQWCVLWPVTAHPQHGQFLFCFEDRRSPAPTSVLQLLVPVVRQPQKPREHFYTVLLAADCVISVSPQQELRLSNRKHILGTMDTAESSGEIEMREWVAALRSAGPMWRQSVSTSPPDASGWLLVREKTLGLATWTSRWCELRGSELSHYEADGDLRSGLIDLAQFTLFTPKMPEAHKPFEFVFLATLHAGGAGTPCKGRAGSSPFSTPVSSASSSSKKTKRRGSVDADGVPFHCMCAQDEGAYSAWQAALGKVAKVATAQQSRGFAARIGIGTGLWHTPSRSGGKHAVTAVEEARVSQEDFEVNSLLGEGAFGRVWLVKPKEHLNAIQESAPEPELDPEPGTPRTSGTPVEPPEHACDDQLMPDACRGERWMAMKVMTKGRVIAERQVEHVQQERKLLQRLDHPFIVNLEYAFQSANSLFLVMEFCQGGDLYQAMHSKPVGSRHFPENATKYIIAELVLALGHLHESDIVYRDLKPENVLFDTEGHVRLTDFGLAKVMNRDQSILRETVCGTPMYMSPEAVKNHHYTLQQQNGEDPAPPEELPGLSNDWWMLGILCYEMLLGTAPFVGESLQTLQTRILTEELSFTPTLVAEDDKDADQISPSASGSPSEAIATVSPEISTAARDFVGRLLDKSPFSRLGTDSTEEVRAHRWFGSTADIGSVVAGGWDWAALERKEILPLYVPASSNDMLSNFPERSDSFLNDADLTFHAPARSVDQSQSDPFTSAKKGAVNDFYFDRQAARAKAAERDAMDALFKQRAAAVGVATPGGSGDCA